MVGCVWVLVYTCLRQWHYKHPIIISDCPWYPLTPTAAIKMLKAQLHVLLRWNPLPAELIIGAETDVFSQKDFCLSYLTLFHPLLHLQCALHTVLTLTHNNVSPHLVPLYTIQYILYSICMLEKLLWNDGFARYPLLHTGRNWSTVKRPKEEIWY